MKLSFDLQADYKNPVKNQTAQLSQLCYRLTEAASDKIIPFLPNDNLAISAQINPSLMPVTSNQTLKRIHSRHKLMLHCNHSAICRSVVKHAFSEMSWSESAVNPLQFHDGSGQQKNSDGINSRQEVTPVVCDFAFLPFTKNSLDFAYLPMTLNCLGKQQRLKLLNELSQCLTECGQLLVSGINPKSVFGVKASGLVSEMQKKPLAKTDDKESGFEIFSLPELKQDLQNVNLQITASRYFQYSLNTQGQTPKYLNWLEKAGDRWWPAMANGYILKIAHTADFAPIVKNRNHFFKDKTDIRTTPSLCRSKLSD